MVKLKTDNKKINIVGIYAPEDCKPEKDREEFYEKLQKVVDEIPNNEIIVIMGDYNARVGDRLVIE